MEIRFKATIQTLNSKGPDDSGGVPKVTLTLQGHSLAERQIANLFELQTGDPIHVLISLEDPEGVQLSFDVPPEGTLPDPFEGEGPEDPGLATEVQVAQSGGTETTVPDAFHKAMEGE